MPKTEMIRARIEPDLKKEVEAIFSELGLTLTSAITCFINRLDFSGACHLVSRFQMILRSKLSTMIMLKKIGEI